MNFKKLYIQNNRHWQDIWTDCKFPLNFNENKNICQDISLQVRGKKRLNVTYNGSSEFPLDIGANDEISKLTLSTFFFVRVTHERKFSTNKDLK